MSLLQEVLADITKELNFYFQINDTLDCDPRIIWKAHKAAIRGVLIKHGFQIKKQRTAQLTDLLQDLHALESRHKHATDQVGFFPSSEARDNTVKVLNLLHVANTTHTPCIFLGTDAEKAFDRVNWHFLFTVLRYVGFDNMLNWISRIYSNPTAQTKANGIFSEHFSITNGTRQGCSLSPLLFALLLEPF